MYIRPGSAAKDPKMNQMFWVPAPTCGSAQLRFPDATRSSGLGETLPGSELTIHVPHLSRSQYNSGILAKSADLGSYPAWSARIGGVPSTDCFQTYFDRFSALLLKCLTWRTLIELRRPQDPTV